MKLSEINKALKELEAMAQIEKQIRRVFEENNNNV